MEVLLAIIVLLVALIGYLFYLNKKLKRNNFDLKQQAIFLSKKELEFLEFTADMYVKYSKDLNIHSKEQHDYIIGELERIRKVLQEKINS